jgi:hypothetical protein
MKKDFKDIFSCFYNWTISKVLVFN